MGVNRTIRLLLLFLAVLPAVSLAGCEGNDKGSSPSNPASAAPAPAEAAAGNVYKDKYDPEVTITTVWGVDPELKFKNGETIEHNVATRWAREMFGINIKSLWSITDTNGAFGTKLRLAMSSGQEMPDIVTIGTADSALAQDLIDSGMYAEVGGLFDAYASETWKKAMAQDPDVWNPYSRGSRKMGLPVLDYAYNHDYILWYRQDWLDKLHMQVPATLGELEKVMEAFKTRNPDGLAPEQVTPLSIGFKTTMNTWMGDPSWIFGAYGALPQQWNMGRDGKLEYGSVNPGIKRGLAKLKEWLGKGYIPQEAALWDENKTAEPAVAGTAGIIPGPYWMSGWPLQDTLQNAPDAVWTPGIIPAGPDGTVMRHGTPFANGVTLISKAMQHPEAFFTYENYLFDNFANPQPGSGLEYGLFAGYDYELSASGRMLPSDKISGGYVNSIRYLLVRDGARVPYAQLEAMLNLADGKAPSTRLEKDISVNYGKGTPAAAKVLLEQKDKSYKDRFTGPATATMKSRLDYLNSLENEVFSAIIYGERPLAAFETFVAAWQAGGGEQITREVNEWHDSVRDDGS
ncbi:extracellular solute-binding protein [Paenibacillus sp. S150]|uniref:extracellular solute-binding protein n=1 Tax=Paenibacillus sp. S150 TaxID=2749826 RepID=UPI001C56FE71|nr:extracellular solute-binding protein [Paenibacillus sp. S150]MBW4082906.1 extracellular solute-binding protein [Paenibacillus sp. S150]